RLRPPSPRVRVPDTSGRVTQPKLREPPGCGSPSAMLRLPSGYVRMAEWSKAADLRSAIRGFESRS
ncbi:Protein WEAK CHLOROPLAST MOVEMENT UNDER BLUE LIGHT-like 3, partial [Frankliniella fusca]